MKKTLLAILSVAMMLSVISCGSTPVAEETETKKGPDKVVSSSYGTSSPATIDEDTEIILKDYSGKNLGAKVPQWVILVSQGNYSASAFAEYMPELADKQLFVIQNRGPNLNFLKQWTNLVDIETEVGSIFQRSIGKALQASQFGSQLEGNTSADEEIKTTTEMMEKMYQASMTNVIAVGLEKKTEFWAKYIEKNSNGEIVNTYYDYYVVYAMDKEYYDEQLQAATQQIPAATDRDKKLKDIMEQAITKQMLGDEPGIVKEY